MGTEKKKKKKQPDDFRQGVTDEKPENSKTKLYNYFTCLNCNHCGNSKDYTENAFLCIILYCPYKALAGVP